MADDRKLKVNFFFFQAEDGIRDYKVTGVQTCALPIAGVIYVPLCLFECAISPQLHFMTFGFYQHDFNQVIRMGGYRPMVFLQHGLAVGMLMTASSICGFWLWWTGSLKSLFGVPVLIP